MQCVLGGREIGRLDCLRYECRRGKCSCEILTPNGVSWGLNRGSKGVEKIRVHTVLVHV
jgi:hypothetical protein